MELLAIERKNSGYHDEGFTSETIASATAIRRGIFCGEDITSYVPTSSLDHLEDQKVCLEDYFPYLKFRLLTMDLASLKQIYQMEAGLAVRMKKCIASCESYESFVNQLKSKRYSQTRIQRLLLYCLLNVKEAEIKKSWQNPSLRVLGFTEKGQKYLQQVKKSLAWPLIARVGKKQAEQLFLTIRADEVYQLAHSKIQEQNFSRAVIRI